MSVDRCEYLFIASACSVTESVSGTMVFRGVLSLFLLFPLVDLNIYMFHTMDSPSVDMYDCVIHQAMFYCRRPAEPMVIARDDPPWQCHHNGTAHSFSDLRSRNISVATVLHRWKSTVEKVEDYALYSLGVDEIDGHVCQCSHPQSFGKNCEYLLGAGQTFDEALKWQQRMHIDHPNAVQMFGEMICYERWTCHLALPCLDWREICDGERETW